MYRNRILLSLPLTAQTYEPTNTRFLDISPNRIHAGYTAGATAPTKIAGQRGASFDGGDLLTGSCNGAFNQAEFSASFLFAPAFAADDGADHYLFDSVDGAAARYFIYKNSANQLTASFGNTSVLAVALATFGPYWKINQYNTLTVTGASADNQAVLNGTSIGTSATAWAAANPLNYWIGCRYSSTLFFTGRMYQAEFRPIRMTMLHALDWHLNAMKTVNAV